DYYYRVRAQPPTDHSPLEAAARFIYLNKTCFNGLYRVNRFGEFNVPIGRYEDPKICQPEKLMPASCALTHAQLRATDFASALHDAQPGDFIYLDPPYPPSSPTAHFTRYTPYQFGRGDQIRLATAYAELDRRGCYVMLSNSDCELTHTLYRRYRMETIRATRSISSDAMTRGAMRELVVLNY
ncbi:MAG: Dam family site-specific DNA-(adenine-N6)-methyltransferase, partial [Candidatus Poribacteria bacterium]|nr:Dam family site-specific DNA-(adenine-N6)-methyltransferase [Candidatus Poribacteria bacterium]